MAESIMEIDFFQIEKQIKASPKPSSEGVGSSCRRIQNVVSKINPLLLKTVMAAGATAHARSEDGTNSWTTNWNPPSQPSSNPSSPSTATLLSPLPALSPSSRSALQGHPETTPLTIFYNGMVAVFDVPRDKAEGILRLVANGIVEDPLERPEDPLLDDDDRAEGDLPIALEKVAADVLGEAQREKSLAVVGKERIVRGAQQADVLVERPVDRCWWMPNRKSSGTRNM